MDYLAHFSFESPDQAYNGYFTMIVSAENVETAISEFEKEILRIHQESDIFSKTDAIFLDDIIEIIKVPEKAVMTRYEIRDKDIKKRVYITLMSPSENLTAYGWHPHGKEKELLKDEHNVEPFILFEQNKDL